VLRDLYPEEFDRKIVCPHCGSEQVRISSAARNRLWRKVQVFMQQLKYQLLRELPEGTYLCENCHREFLYRKNWYKAQRKAKFYINKCRSASCMQGGLKQASA
jgi:hypothetical protein